MTTSAEHTITTEPEFKVSVIIPTYKPQNYLWECLSSLNRQTMSKNDFEVLIVLNGCCEPWKGKIENYISEQCGNLNIRLIQTDEPGVSNARNIGMEQMSGHSICFLDDDDWISDNYLKLLWNEYEPDMTIEASVVRFYEATGQYIRRQKEQTLSGHTRQYMTVWQGRRFLSSSCCKLIPRHVVAQQCFNTSFIMGEDALFMASISNRLKGVKYISTPVYYRRVRQESVSQRKLNHLATELISKPSLTFN